MAERLVGMGVMFQCIALITLSLSGSGYPSQYQQIRQRVALMFSLLAFVCISVGGPWLWK
jgi:hypothetical protein